VLEKTLAALGRLDILVNNAGITIIKPLVYAPDLESGMGKLIPGFFSSTTEALRGYTSISSPHVWIIVKLIFAFFFT
jgi:NAD(P)-dependent dehydrogenase (short-subunit alcohol dehydrogenase family)